MARYWLLILLSLAVHLPSQLGAQTAPLPATPVPATDTVRVMSFNVRYWNTSDGENRWELRRHRVVGILRLQRADIFGVQEAMPEQIRYLADELPTHDWFGIGRDLEGSGERCTIFWDRAKFDRIDGATFWLSETPDRPTNAWGAELRRICTWCEFRSKATKKAFFVFNTHFDHQSANARERSAQLVRQRIHDLAGQQPVVLMGDLNCDGFSPPYAALTAPSSKSNAAAPLLDARVWTEHDFGPQGTWSGWNPTFIGKRIDYVFVKNAARVLQHAVVPHEWQGRVASDHFPVLAEVSLHAGAEPRSRSMVHLWRMMPDDQGNGEALGYLKPEFDDRKWPTMSAGDAWERQGHPNLDGVVFLRKKIYVPSSWRHRTVQFVTAGIADMYSLHVNGVKVHEAGSKSENVWADRINLHLANSTLHFGAENTFVLRVTDFGGLGGLLGHPLLLTIDDRQPTHSSVAFATRVLVPEKRLEIPDGSGQAELEVAVPAHAAKPSGNAALAWLRVGFGNGDEPSDGTSLRCELQQADGTVVHRAISDQLGTVWLQHQVDYGSKWQVVITIADSNDPEAAAIASKSGKGCNITVELKVDAGK